MAHVESCWKLLDLRGMSSRQRSAAASFAEAINDFCNKIGTKRARPYLTACPVLAEADVGAITGEFSSARHLRAHGRATKRQIFNYRRPD
jgi:hypothetical protein